MSDTTAEQDRADALEALTPDERAVLAALAVISGQDTDCLNFNALARRTEMSRDRVRIAARGLRARGLATFERGLFDEDGMPYGSGYSCTAAGAALVKAEPCLENTQS